MCLFYVLMFFFFFLMFFAFFVSFLDIKVEKFNDNVC